MSDETRGDAPDEPGPHDLQSTEYMPASRGEVRSIGPYRLLEKLGEGGMGEVWLAEQTEPVRRKVALKVIKQGMDTRQVVARFEAERQALAMMDHPAIAKVHDAGAGPRGRPYFVMEHVRGVPVTEHCDRNRLNNRERLDLFVRICEGVQHAHQKAVIHRDLKPSNVLVAVQDGRAIPKIIDFGVAKATAQKLTEKTMHTQLGMLVGTPEYMSPEQAEMTGQDIDTRTDVYALGVMLYELLVGALPFDPKELRQAGVESIVRTIRDKMPPRPSTRLSTLGEQSSESAQRRRTELPALRRELSGDLDWIVMKALEKDRTRRYGSPQELAADLGRHLRNEPVLAGPPSAAYRARKFVRRHRVGVALAAGGLLLLLAFAATMSVQAGRIARERDRASREARSRGQVAQFMKDLFKMSDPSEARGSSITARELLARGAEKIDEAVEQPELRAELMLAIGQVYRTMGLYEQAEPLLYRALETLVQSQGAAHPDTLAAMDGLAELYGEQGRYDEAIVIYGELIEVSEPVLGAEHPDRLYYKNNVAAMYRNLARYEEAERLYLETIEAEKRVLGPEHPDTLISVNGLAILYRRQGRYDDAEPLVLEALDARRRTLGADHPDTLISMDGLANLYRAQSRYAEAEPLYRASLEGRTRVLGPDHPYTLGSMNNLAELYGQQGRYAEAERYHLDALAARERLLGADHPDVAESLHNLACLCRETGRHDEASLRFEQARRILEHSLGEGHPRVIENLEEHAGLLRRMGAETEAALLEARAGKLRSYPPLQ